MGRFTAAILMVCASSCAAATPAPASLTAILQLQIRQQAGLYATDLNVPGAAHEAEYLRLKAWAERNKIVVTTADLEPRHLRGSTQPGYGGWVVLLHRDMSPDGKLHTLIHELAHIYGPSGRTEQEREVIAELTAMLVCQRLGMDVRAQTAGYFAFYVPVLEVQSWTVQRCGAQIDRLVEALAKVARG